MTRIGTHRFRGGAYYWWVRERLGHRHLGFEPLALDEPEDGTGSPFRAFLLAGRKP